MGDDNDHAAGRHEEFVQKWSEYSKLLYPYALKLTGNEADAEDLVQGAFRRFLAHMETTEWKEEITDEFAYLKTIVRNQYNSLLRRRKRERLVGYDDEQNEHIQKELDAKAKQINDPTDSIEHRLTVEKRIRQLPWSIIFSGWSEYELQLFGLKLEGLSNKEIAQEVGKDIGSVSYYINKLNARIRARGRRLEEGSGNNGSQEGGA
jgi:RNA polymerase sigma factor (sigma-70 family)